MITQAMARKAVGMLGHKDVLILYMPYCHGDEYGAYYPENSLILAYTRDEEGKRLPLKEIEDTVLHELTHHIQCKSNKCNKSDWHNDRFEREFAKLKEKYYNEIAPKIYRRR